MEQALRGLGARMRLRGGLVLRSFATLRMTTIKKRWAESFGGFFGGDEVDLFEEGAFLPSGAGE